MLEAPFKWRLPLVVLGAGRGRRLESASSGLPKILLPIGDSGDEGRKDTVLDLLVRAWKPWASELHLVAAEDTDRIRTALQRQSLPARLHLQPEPDGTVNALLRLAGHLPGRFVVVLGDCLARGRFEDRATPFPGIGVWRDADPDSARANYTVDLLGEKVTAVQEKPTEVNEDLCGMGVYFLDGDFIEGTVDLPPNRQGRRELTDALGHFLDRGGTLHSFFFSGSYVNINTPEDLRRARLLFDRP